MPLVILGRYGIETELLLAPIDFWKGGNAIKAQDF